MGKSSQEPKSRLQSLPIVIAIIAAALLGMVGGYFIGSPFLLPFGQDSAQEGESGGTSSLFLPVQGSPSWGSDSAPATIIEFSDFECPACKRLSDPNSAIERLKHEFGPDRLRVVYKNYPLPFHLKAPLAHKAAFAAFKQNKFWEYHNLVLEKQEKTGDKNLSQEDLEGHAKTLGLDLKRFKKDMASKEAAQKIVQDKFEADLFGISGTPSFLINGATVKSDFRSLHRKIQEEIDLYDDLTATSNGAEFSEGFYAMRVSMHLPEAARKSLKRLIGPNAKGNNSANKAKGPEKRFLISTGNSPAIGSPSAPVTIIEFSDFECPYCTKGANIIKELVKNNPGKVKVVFKHYPLPFHKNAPLAHKASIAAQNQGKFWPLHDLLFENRKALKRPDLEGYAEQIGLNMELFRADIDSDATAKRLKEDQTTANRADVRGTPHFFFNGARHSGAQPLEKFQAILDRELKIAKKYNKGDLRGAGVYAAVVKGENAKLPKTGAKSKPSRPRPPEPTSLVKVNVDGAPFKGPIDAPVTIVEFSDFECPYCGKVSPTIEQIMKEYPTQVKIVFKQLPLSFHKHAALAAEASLAAHAQGKFWEYHDILFANRKELQRESLDAYAEQLGLDMVRFKADLDNHTFQATVAKEKAEAARNQIRGTPNFAVNGRRVKGAQPFASFKAIIDEELKKTP